MNFEINLFCNIPREGNKKSIMMAVNLSYNVCDKKRHVPTLLDQNLVEDLVEK